MNIERGFTLLEFLLVIVITSILAAVGASLLAGVVKSYQLGQERATLANQASVIFAKLGVDLTLATHIDNTQNVVGTQSGLSFHERGKELIHYTQSGTLLMREIDGETNYQLGEKLQATTGFRVNYFGDEGTNNVSNASQVRFVEVTVNLMKPGTSSPEAFTRIFAIG